MSEADAKSKQAKKTEQAEPVQQAESAEQSTSAQEEQPERRNAGAMRVLAGFFWLLASLAIMVSGVTLWAHQTLLTSDGWSTIVAGVVSDEEVMDSASARIVERLSESLAIEEKIAEILPGEMNIVASAISGGIADRVTEGLADFASREGVQDAFVSVNRVAHDAAMKVIRGGDSEVLTSEEGAITLNVLPLVEGALLGLQEAGLIDESREIPDLSEYEAPAEAVAKLEQLLGRDLPDDIGTITLIESDRLASVQTAVRNFDLITIGLLLLALAAILLALWTSARRVRMVLWLALGAVAALLLGRGFTRLIIEDITGSLRDAEGAAAVQAVVTTSVDSLMWFSFALIVVALLVAGLAIWYERHEDDATREAERAESQSVNQWLHTRAHLIGYIGLGLIAFVVLWNVGGPDITLLAAAATGLLLIAISLLAARDDHAEPDDEVAAGGGSS